MRTVQIADDVYAALQGMAVPFEDDINDVLRRLLREARSTNGNGAHRIVRNGSATVDPEAPDSTTVVVHRRVAGPEQHLPQTAFRAAVLGVLRSSREPVGVSALLGEVERQLGDRMSDGDIATSSGDIHWHIQTRNALAQLIHEGAIVQLPEEHYLFRNGQRRS